MPTAREVADFFLSKSRPDEGDVITHLKLQKLTYYAQGFSLAVFDTPLFRETIEAWDHGPVVPALYHQLKEYGAYSLPVPQEEEARKPFSEEQLGLLEDVYQVYGQFSAWKLRAMTHNEPPWENNYPSGQISQKEMARYFKTQVED